MVSVHVTHSGTWDVLKLATTLPELKEKQNAKCLFLLMALSYLNKDTAYIRDSSSPSSSRKCCLHDFIQYGGLSDLEEG